MPQFHSRFRVAAPVARVSAFHFSPEAFLRLTPPGMLLQVHLSEPLGEGSMTEFTLWSGPLPMRWKALHSELSATGFTDEQIAGPLRSWRHRHQFIPHPEGGSEVLDSIDYEHPPGWRGLLSRLRFNAATLQLLFFFRARATRRACRE
jgi:ligand-binding SRPBCC domain-containing protein